jgi:hypothetical protein
MASNIVLDRNATSLHGSRPPLPLGLAAYLNAQNIRYSLALKQGGFRTLSLELTPSMCNRHIFQDQKKPLAVIFSQAMRNRTAQAAELILPARAELNIIEYLLKRFTGVTPGPRFEVDDFLIKAAGFPGKITLNLHFEEDKPWAVTCPEFQWLAAILSLDESSSTDRPAIIKKTGNGILYRRPASEDSSFDMVLCQKIPLLNQVAIVAADLRSGNGPAFHAAFYNIDLAGHKLILYSSHLERSGIKALEETSFPDLVAEIYGSDDPDMIAATRTAVAAGHKRLGPSVQISGLSPGKRVIWEIANEKFWACTLAGEMVKALQDLAGDPLYAKYLRHLSAGRKPAN